jgi:hypothetical protein
MHADRLASPHKTLSTTTLQSWTPNVGLISVAVIASLAVALAALAGRDSLWIDEAITGLAMRQAKTWEDLVAFFRTTNGSEAAQSLYYVIVWFWTRLAGDGESALRLPSILFSLFAVAALWSALRAADASRATAAAGATALLALPAVMWYSVEARPYALILCVSAAHLACTLWFVRSPTARRLCLVAAMTLVSALAYPVAAGGASLSFAIALGWLLVSPARRSLVAWRFALPVTAATAAAVAVVVLWSLSRSSGVRAPESLGASVASMTYAVYELLLGRSLGYSVVELREALGLSGVMELLRSNPLAGCVAIAAAGGLLAVIGAGIRGLRLSASLVPVLVGGPWLLAGALLFAYSIVPGFLLLGRHVIFVIPAVVLLVTLGVRNLSQRARVWSVLVMTLVGALSLLGILADARYAKDDFRSISQVVARCGFSPDRTVLLASERGFSYYGVAGLYLLRDRGDSFQQSDPGSGDVQDGLAFLRLHQSQPVLLVVDVSRYDHNGYVEREAQKPPQLYRRDVAGLTMLATVDIRSCA